MKFDYVNYLMKVGEDQRLNSQIQKIALLTNELHDLKTRIHKANNDNVQMKQTLSYDAGNNYNNDDDVGDEEEGMYCDTDPVDNNNNNSNDNQCQMTEIPEENEDEREFLANLYQDTYYSKSKANHNDNRDHSFHDNQINLLSQRNTLLTENIVELSSKIEHFNTVIPSLLNKVESYKIALEKSNSKTLQVQEKLVISKTENKALKSEIAKLKSETTLLKTENDSLQKIITSLYDRDKDLNDQIELLQEKDYNTKTFMADYDNIKNNQQRLIQENEEHINEINSRNNLIEKLKREKTQYEKDIQQYEKYFNQAKEEIRVLSLDNEEWKEYYTFQINDLAKRNKELMTRMSSSSSSPNNNNKFKENNQ